MAGLLVAGLGLAAVAAAQSSVGAYGQCGGSGYTGATACVSGYFCTEYNSYYYQCVPGTTTGASPTSTQSTPASTTAGSTTAASTSSISATTTTSSASSATATPSGTSTLSSGWYWIRAVETPYYHSYLQTLPTATPGDALMDSPETAGQFNIIDGQLVYNAGSGAGEGALYMWVEDPEDKTQRALSTWFNSTQNTYGNFSFSGDTVTWVDPDVSRGNTAAFYVCPSNTTGANDLYVNTGAYDYETPSGCYDIDIHSYGGSTATV